MARARPGVAPPEPDDAALRALLGASFPAYRQFLEANAGLRPEWKYYGGKSGWSLKLFAGRRNLCFVIPHEDYFTIAFALSSGAVAAALAAPLPQSVKQEMRAARAYAEGTPVRVPVRVARDLDTANLLLELKRAN